MADAPILADILRRPGYLKLLVVCRLVGIPVSAVAFGFLALEHRLTDVLAALTVSMLRFPVASILLASTALAAMPVIILAAVTAFVVTELLDPPSSPR